MNRFILRPAVLGACALLVIGCASLPVKKYYVLNYIPSTNRERLSPAAYPCTIRLREFNIEDAYNRPQIVFRQSPFELRYYYYRVWAVKPARMITDLVYKHLLSANLVSTVVRRFDEGANPEYELTGVIEALDEYDSEEIWFAHIAIRLTLSRIDDGYTMYTRRFDLRKRVYEHKPENVVREMSSLMEFIMTQPVRDLDTRLAREYGVPQTDPGQDTLDLSPEANAPDTAGEVK
ncbi:MAG: membrane integrity-associated transporter subunit PqiC [Chitinispirillaceae bacterium]|nr:membrane integrity-associated transporter subunit PqiC [Chitinispirillaceae bacterium]